MASVDLEILFPAFLAGLLVLSTHVPLGQLVLERGIVVIDLAIAQVAGLGVVAADAMGWEPNGWSVQVSAVAAALGAAALPPHRLSGGGDWGRLCGGSKR